MYILLDIISVKFRLLYITLFVRDINYPALLYYIISIYNPQGRRML